VVLQVLIFNQMVKYNGAAMTSIFHALADPTRRALVEALGTKERTVGELADPLSISLPAVSKHIDHEGLQPAIDWIEQQRQIWEGSFDKLSSYLEIHN
jgi:hypothetical protein